MENKTLKYMLLGIFASILMAFAFAVIYSRLYLGMHSYNEVILGGILGLYFVV